jgi:hypothetical protein
MTPPATTLMSAARLSRSRLISSGIRVLCPAASDDAPTTSTSLSSASTRFPPASGTAGRRRRRSPCRRRPRRSRSRRDRGRPAPFWRPASGVRPRRWSTACTPSSTCAKRASPCIGGGIDALHRVGTAIAAEDLFHSVGNFAQRGAGAGGFDGEREQVAAAFAPSVSAAKRGLARASSRRPSPLDPGDLTLAHLGVVDFQRFEVVFGPRRIC